MYIPRFNEMNDESELVEFMKKFSFATIVTAKQQVPTATHLPFYIEQRPENIVLVAHFARANTQWQDIENNTVLVIFSEPHAYISPTHYEKELNVPTWNYVAVHAYGQAKIITETEAVFQILEKTILTYEAAYQQQWQQLPEDYKLKLSKGIVAFEMTVNALEGKKKISQNRTAAEQANIIASLSKSADSNEKHIADYMLKEQNKIQ
ncbi:MAG: FMN-binding negative transcriptional regulator [Sphingobacteriales bacterium]|nr:FMN-binding negative transcriptional regulator [Sphingobacteriales bacterium]